MSNTDFAKHFQQLLNVSYITDEKRSVKQWLSLSLGTTESASHEGDVLGIDDDAPAYSILNVLAPRTNTDWKSRVNASDPLGKLLMKPHIQAQILKLHSILSPGTSDERASTQLAELAGFDEIESVFEIMSQRHVYLEKLEALLSGPLQEESFPGRPSTPTQDLRRGKKGKRYGSRPGTPPVILDDAASQRHIEETLRANALRPLFSGVSHHAKQEYLPHVYTSSSMSQNNVLSHLGTKYLLPINTERHKHEEYEEVIVPPANPVPPRGSERLVSISELDDLCSGSFPGYSSLNRIQSIVYPTAYETNENMLICAPTGAGKTDVAMLSVLHVLNDFRSRDRPNSPLPAQIKRDEFKIIYVAPMKALASEIVRKLGKRLKWLDIKARELTGDMQMTKAEIAETQIIVTTPEKWDVVTRKPTGEGELASKVKLLIIDEVHLLNDERGAVIETIVARTLRQVESTQSMIRIVGLSATLPNYIDVADFLRVSRQSGLFYFDSSFRPVPLEQHFIGVRGKPGSEYAKKNLDKVVFEKTMQLIEQGHQVMVFVHARKETVKSAQALKEMAMIDGRIDEFSCASHEQMWLFKREVGTSRNKELRELFELGFGIHHAGMLRSDRNFVERAFEARAIKLLCCTATLAWGVNLPAHAVIIKGTQVYDSSQGKFVDLSVLDVLQIFGRAGRPGMESSGEGYICSGIDKMDHYLEAVTAQHPIESKFVEGMVDSLNAEIALGTVTNESEAIQWIGYTYLFVRLRKNPHVYGISYDEIIDDPQLGHKRSELVQSKATQLASARMILYDRDKKTFTITDLGRIAAKYYIRSETVMVFNETFRARMSEADVLHMLCKSTEFEQIQLRENEVKELEAFLSSESIVPCQVKDGAKTNQGKVNILLQAYISRVSPEDFALVSDMSYVAQNAGRIIRALLEIAISRKWATVSAVLISLSKAIEKRMWPFEHPLYQFGDKIKREVMYNITQWADDYAISELSQMTAHELGQLIHMNEQHGSVVLQAAKEFPEITLTYELRPLTSDLLRISVLASRSFTWGRRRDDTAIEPFWVWIEDADGTNILQLAHVVYRKSTEDVELEFIIQVNSSRSLSGIRIRYISDKWMGAEDDVYIPLSELIKPNAFKDFTQVTSQPFVELDTEGNNELRRLFPSTITSLNAIQTHAYWSFMGTDRNALLCAPAGSGKSTLAQLLSMRTIQNAESRSWILVISPKRGLAVDFATGVRPALSPLGIAVDVVRDDTPSSPSSQKALRIMSPSTLISFLSRPDNLQILQSLRLIICDNLELLGAEYELAVTLLLHATQNLLIRFVGLSTCLTDPSGLADWLHVPTLSMNCFRPSDREQDLRTSIQTFTIPQSGALYKAMAKPAHTAISSGQGEFSLIFVPSRGQCKPFAYDLITQCAMDGKMQGYLPNQYFPDALEPYTSRLQDEKELGDLLQHGIGVYHDGMRRRDRAIVLELIAEGIVKVLVTPHDALWSIPLRAPVVVVAGTQYTLFDGKKGVEQKSLRNRKTVDYPLEEIVHMQGRAVQQNMSGKFHLLCQADGRETLAYFLDEGLPLESTLHHSEVLKKWLHSRVPETTDSHNSEESKQQTRDILSWTYLMRRMKSNPMYYDAVPDAPDISLSKLVDKLYSSV